MRTTVYFVLLVPALIIAAIEPAAAATLPDTGIDICQNGTGNDAVPATDLTSVARDGGPYPRQDCRYGNDPAAAAGALSKTGAGARGFDYIRIANNGALAAGPALGPNPTDWACTRDNNTGLTWEVKAATAGLRFSGHTYSWFNSDPATNGGEDGTIDAYPGGDTCGTTVVFGCYSQGYRLAVNAATLCGANDWRMPTLRELLTLSHFGVSNPSIDAAYFPNTINGDYWSDSTYAPNSLRAWFVAFGASNFDIKSLHKYVRLVRGVPF